MKIVCNSYSTWDLCLDYSVDLSWWVLVNSENYNIYDIDFITDFYSFELWVLIIVCIIFWIFWVFNLVKDL